MVLLTKGEHVHVFELASYGNIWLEIDVKYLNALFSAPSYC